MKERIRYCVKKSENDIGKYFKSYKAAYEFCLKNKSVLFKNDDDREILIIDMRQ